MAMNLLDSVQIDHPGTTQRSFNLYTGDVTEMSGHEVTFLVVSALPGDYSPTPGSVMGSLAAKGVNVQAMAKDKAANYEPAMPCWVSNPVANPQPGIAFSRLLVYEPLNPAKTSAAMVDSIFRALSLFQGSKTTSVALPLVSTGSVGADPDLIMRALFFAAVGWGSRHTFALPVINLVLYPKDTGLIARMRALFSDLKKFYQDIYSQVPSNYASQARGVAGRFSPLPANLSYRQIFGIALYTTNYYGTVNSVLRNYNITRPEYQQMMPVFECIDSGLANVPAWTGTANRGSSYYSSAYAEYQVGNTIVHPSYMSYSYGSSFGGALQIETQSLFGNKIDSYSIYAGEKEILFERGMNDKVTKTDWNSSHTGAKLWTTEVNPYRP